MKKQTFKKQLNEFEKNIKTSGMYMAMVGRCETVAVGEYGERELRVFKGKKGKLWYDVGDFAKIVGASDPIGIVREQYRHPESRVFFHPCDSGEHPFLPRVCVDKSGLSAIIDEGTSEDTMALMKKVVWDIPKALERREVLNED